MLSEQILLFENFKLRFISLFSSDTNTLVASVVFIKCLFKCFNLSVFISTFFRPVSSKIGVQLINQQHQISSDVLLTEYYYTIHALYLYSNQSINMSEQCIRRTESEGGR